LKKGYIPKIESALSFKKDFFIEYFIIKNKWWRAHYENIDYNIV
jgi:hypothetical protein